MSLGLEMGTGGHRNPDNGTADNSDPTVSAKMEAVRYSPSITSTQ